MTSTTLLPPQLPPAELAALVAQARADAGAVAQAVSGAPGAADVGALDQTTLAEHARDLLRASDQLAAAGSALLQRLQSGPGALVAGRWASVPRFLEAEVGLGLAAARAVAARAHDLRDDVPAVADAWLAGDLSSDGVRVLTLGLRDLLRAIPLDRRDEVRDAVLAILLPLAAQGGTPADLALALRHLRLTLDPVTADREAVDSAESQSLTCEQVGSMARITAWLTLENAAAVMTVLHQRVDRAQREGDLSPDQVLPAGVDPASWQGRRLLRTRRGRALAEVLADTMRGLLDRGEVGTHHAVAPHVTLTVDLDHLAGPLPALLAGALPVGTLALPGHDEPALLPASSVRRALCDCSLTAIVARGAPCASQLDSARVGAGTGDPLRAVATALVARAREVLWVGRAVRTVTVRQRRALEARDRHCAFPGCRAHPRRCRAHHVLPWEQGGGSDLDNLVLVCDTHHHAVHEGGWTLTAAPGRTARESGAWAFHPPPDPGRP